MRRELFVPAYKQRRRQRVRRVRIRIVGDVGEKARLAMRAAFAAPSAAERALMFAEGGEVIEMFRMRVDPRDAEAAAEAPAEGVAPPREGGAA